MDKQKQTNNNTTITHHPEVAPGDHDAVGFLEDLVVILEALQVLDFADDLDERPAVVGEQLFQVADVFGLPDETRRDEFDLALDAEFDDIFAVLVGEGRQIDLDARQVHVFAFANAGIVEDTRRDFILRGVCGEHLQHETAVGDENVLAFTHARIHLVVGAGEFGRNDRVALVRVVGRLWEGNGERGVVREEEEKIKYHPRRNNNNNNNHFKI